VFASKGLQVAAASRGGAQCVVGISGVTPYTVDAADPASVQNFVDTVERELGPIRVAVFNAAPRPKRKSIIDLDPKDFEQSWRSGCLGGLLLGQATASRMCARGNSGTILFTGATASLRGGSQLADFASAKCGLRAVAQSMARELGPRGVHVAHVIVDGLIAGEIAEKLAGPASASDSRMDPDALALCYWQIHEQGRSAWTHELDLRPYCEKF
jgi:NAD(P)-dependent dehydrogenase (short-subunit alcohol dehydrogenase family)